MADGGRWQSRLWCLRVYSFLNLRLGFDFASLRFIGIGVIIGQWLLSAAYFDYRKGLRLGRRVPDCYMQKPWILFEFKPGGTGALVLNAPGRARVFASCSLYSL